MSVLTSRPYVESWSGVVSASSDGGAPREQLQLWCSVLLREDEISQFYSR